MAGSAGKIGWAWLRTGVALVAIGASGCGPVGGATAQDPGDSQALERLLSDQGYTKIALSRLPTGHFSLGGSAGGVPLFLILDTGASHTVLDAERAQRFGLSTEDRGSQATGVGLTSQSVESGRLEDVVLGSLPFGSLRVSVLDLSEVNRILARFGNEPVDGIMGADVLMARQAVIDYGSLTVFMKE